LIFYLFIFLEATLHFFNFVIFFKRKLLNGLLKQRGTFLCTSLREKLLFYDFLPCCQNVRMAKAVPTQVAFKNKNRNYFPAGMAGSLKDLAYNEIMK